MHLGWLEGEQMENFQIWVEYPFKTQCVFQDFQALYTVCGAHLPHVFVCPEDKLHYLNY